MTRSIYFTSDLHLGHKGIMNFGKRNHSDLTEMHIAIMEAWNSRVRKMRDIVWVLGDVCMDIKELHWLNLMNGEKRLILGNHDRFDYGVYRKYFNKVMHFHQAYRGIVLTHIPIHPNELQYRNWKYNVHGHIHDKYKDVKDPRYLNVNIDVAGYAPLHLDEVRQRLSI